MSVFLRHPSTGSGEQLESLQEAGLTGFIKKFYTGKDEEEIKEYKDALQDATTKVEIRDVIDNIESSLEKAKDFKGNSSVLRFIGHSLFAPGGIIAGVAAAAYNNWAKTGAPLKKLNAHISSLEALLKQANSKLSSAKK